MSSDPRPVAIGVDIGGTKLVAATISAEGTVVDRHRRETPAHDADLLVGTLAGLVDELGGGLPVGVGIAGLVTPDGRVRYGPNIGIRDLDLRSRLAAVTGAEVTVLNDASAAAFGEQQVGAARGHADMVLVTLGTGVGGGIVTGGRLLLGANGFGGELGHLIVAEGGRRCPCGNRGCIEAYASGTAIALQARERLVDRSVDTSLREVADLDGRAVTTAAQAGDEFARGLLADVGGWLGVALASVVNLVDPGVVLLGGGAALQTAPWVRPAAEAAMADRLVGSRWRHPPAVELAALGDDAGMVGAALHARDRQAAA